VSADKGKWFWLGTLKPNAFAELIGVAEGGGIDQKYVRRYEGDTEWHPFFCSCPRSISLSYRPVSPLGCAGGECWGGAESAAGTWVGLEKG